MNLNLTIEDLKLKVQEYEKKVEENTFALNIEFITKTEEMPISLLRTEISQDVVRDYDVVYLSVDKVVSNIDRDPNLFSKEKLFVLKEFTDTARLINLIETGTKVIPPIIIHVNKGLWKIFDGSHRIGLMRYLQITTAPFLIRKNDIKFVSLLK